MIADTKNPTADARSLEWVREQERNRENSERLPDCTLLLFTAESLVSCWGQIGPLPV